MSSRKRASVSRPGVVVGVEHGLLRVQAEDGTVVPCRAEGISKATDYRVGEGVRIGAPLFGRSVAHRARAPSVTTTSAPMIRPLMPAMQRAVSASLAAGDSAWTIASRYGISPNRVHR